MKLNKITSHIGGLLCITLVCLLSFASVSPQIHAWFFHSDQLTNSTCSEVHSNCSKLPDTSEEGKSQPDMPDNKDHFCPVGLFEQGVDFTNVSVFSMPERCSFIASIEAEPDTVRTSYFKGEVQARAPPAG